jgi:serine/threonine protein kinase
VTQIEANGTAGLAGGGSFPFGMIKILDLGLARFDETFNSDADKADPLTVAGQGGLRGSADYLAPEQAVDFHAADIRADIYSLGCVFYFLLAGKPPFDGGSLALKLIRHQNNAPPPLEKVRTDVPRKLLPLVNKMMAKKPSERFQTPGEVAAAIAATAQRGWLGLWRG